MYAPGSKEPPALAAARAIWLACLMACVCSAVGSGISACLLAIRALSATVPGWGPSDTPQAASSFASRLRTFSVTLQAHVNAADSQNRFGYLRAMSQAYE